MATYPEIQPRKKGEMSPLVAYVMYEMLTPPEQKHRDAEKRHWDKMEELAQEQNDLLRRELDCQHLRDLPESRPGTFNPYKVDHLWTILAVFMGLALIFGGAVIALYAWLSGYIYL